MTLITNYSTLRAAVSDWLNRTDLDARVETFIQMFEARLRRVLRWKHPGTISAEFSDGSFSGTLTMPDLQGSADPMAQVTEIIWASFRNITSGVKFYPAELVTFDELQALRNDSPQSGRPTKFALVFSSSIVHVWPTPDDDYALYMSVDGPTTIAPPLSSVSDEQSQFNALIANYPDVYLYGALTEAAPYLKDDERLPVWKSRVDEALRELVIARDRFQFAGKPPRRKLPVVF